MSKSLNPTILALGAALALLSAAGTARADFETSVTVGVTPESGGVFLYTYIVTDLAASTANIGEFDLAVSAAADLTSITMANGFLALYTAGDASIQFLSTDSTTDITPTFSGVFSFESLLGPGQQADLTRTFDDTGSSPNSNAGFTLAPTSVPEPASLGLLGLGALGLSVARARIARREPSR